MTLNHHELATLDLLFSLASSDVPATAIRLAEHADRSADEVRRDLAALARRGLVDAERCRLTFPGLAIAAGRKSQAERVATRRAA